MEKNVEYFEIWVQIDAIQDETKRLEHLAKGIALEEVAKKQLLAEYASKLAPLYESIGLRSDGKSMDAPGLRVTPVMNEILRTTAPIPKQRAQEFRILELLQSKGHDALKLPNWEPGKGGVKSSIRKLALLETALFTKKTFDSTWQRLRDDGRMADIA